MAESGGVAAAAGGGSFNDILENWSNIGNLFLAFVIAGLVPLVKTISKKYTTWKDKRDAEQAAKEKAAIIEIAKEVQQPLNTKMNNMEEILAKYTEQNETIIDHMNIIEQMLLDGRVTFTPNSGGNKRGRPSKHFDNASGSGDQSGYNPSQRRS